MKLIIIALLLIAIEYIYIQLARRFHIYDEPTQRSSHSKRALRGGGIIYLLAPWLWAALYGWEYTWFMVGLLLVGAVSLFDDIKPQSISLRLIVQFIAVALMLIDVPLYGAVSWWFIVLSLIVGVGVINAYNFMDGIDSITGFYTLAVITPVAYLNGRYDFINPELLFVTGVAVIVFLLYSLFGIRKCFTGDVGSISIAFIVFFAIARLIEQSGNLAYMLFLAVYGVDAILTIIHRLMLGENIGSPHRKHLYQILSNEVGVSQNVVAAIYALLQLAISIGLIELMEYRWIYFTAVCVALMIIYIVLINKYYHLHANNSTR